jgi:hypothetical protein
MLHRLLWGHKYEVYPQIHFYYKSYNLKEVLREGLIEGIK